MSNSYQAQKLFNNIFHSDLFRNQYHQNLISHYRDLKSETYLAKIYGHRPTKYNNIRRIHNFVLELFAHWDQVIVFAIDSLSFEYFVKDICESFSARHGALSGVLSSTFPSTTGAAWPSIIYGVEPASHGIYGTSFLHEQLNMNYVWTSDTTAHKGSRKRLEQGKEISLNLSNELTVFEKLMTRGIFSHYFGFHGKSGATSTFIRELTKGAFYSPPDLEEYHYLKRKPSQLVRSFLQMLSLLLDSKRQEKVLAWSYIDFDDYIHENGYQALSENFSWRELFNFCENYSWPRRVFLFISDHGQTIQKKVDVQILDISEDNDDLDFNTGGAGRTLYFYPRKGREENVEAWLKELVGNTSVILRRHELIELGILGANPIALDRIGEYVVVATEPEFLSVGGPFYVAEHGACSAEEMFVPIFLLVTEK